MSVCGLDPQKSGDAFKQEIGAVLQSTALPDKIRVEEALRLFASFYRRHRKARGVAQALRARREAQRLLLPAFRRAETAAGPGDVAGQRSQGAFSSTSRPPGSTRRCAAKSTTSSKSFEREKKTILLTTHYIEEAERLCDRVAIVDQGRVIAQGTPRELKQRSGNNNAHRSAPGAARTGGRAEELEGVADCRLRRQLHPAFERPPQTIVSLVKHLEAQGNELVSLEIAAPSLEDVFLELTGRRLRD